MPPTKIVITKNREINQAQAASPPPLRTTYVNARFRIHKTSQTVSATTLSPLRIYIIAFSNLFYNKITRLFAFYISVFRVFAPYPHALRPLRPCDKKRLARSRAADQAFAEQTIRGERSEPHLSIPSTRHGAKVVKNHLFSSQKFTARSNQPSATVPVPRPNP